MKIVLQKFIAQAGFSSRRKAEDLIRNKMVLVNGQPAELGMKVDENDDVKVRGEKIKLANEKIYIMLNKPKGYTCTNRKFPGEKNVFELLMKPPTSPQPSPYKEEGGRLFIVGRLDKNSRGLVLLTNDGDLTQKLTHPKYEHEKEYFVETRHCLVSTDVLTKKLKTGVDIGEGDGMARAKDAKYIENNKLKIILTEGKKRQIRRMFKILGCDVIDIIRTRIGNLKLDDLPEGQWRYLENEEIKNLK